MNKKRTMVQLTDMQIAYLEEKQQRLGIISRSDLIRRIIDKDMQEDKDRRDKRNG